MNVLRAWCVNGLFQMTKSRTVLTIPLPVKLIPLRMYVKDGELVVVFATTQKGPPSDTVSKYNQFPSG